MSTRLQDYKITEIDMVKHTISYGYKVWINIRLYEYNND